jgi:hypothetical protein
MADASSALAPAHAFDDPRLGEALRRLASGRAEDVAEAGRLLHAAAGQGVAVAWSWLATLRAAGVGAPQDWEIALDHLLAAADGGCPSAQGQLTALADEANDVTAGDWAALRRSVRVAAWLGRGEKEVLNTSPRLVAMRGFLPKAACAWLKSRTERPLSPALLLTGEPPPRDRKYRAYAFNFIDTDVVLLLTRARIAANIGFPVGAFEVSQILHYKTGENFGLHWDYLRPELPTHAAEIARNGQRIVTFVIYLNADFEDGCTHFPELDLRFRGEPGDGFYWANVDLAGAPDPRSLHAGLAPTTGEKYLLSQGVRSIARV